eukprot:TRINITY_DN1164_c0_g1_i1.p1 TRINITY_DN1164_c0_g1~~TRINITY_DN1164_c0_g1_i1.p1  ORF type:complete len:393 (+),score=104.37 TRINITY_DN1164_c0_g1_i1:30-1208(+)
MNENEKKSQNDDKIGENNVEIVIEEGWRIIKPYFNDSISFAKERWINRTLLDVFTSEFPHRPEKYYEEAIDQGRLRFLNRPTTRQTKIKSNDQILHSYHFHEPPIFDNLQIVKETERYFVINKPATVPVHRTGRFHFNSVVEILKNMNIHVKMIHRLDIPTSGLLIMPKTKEDVRDLSKFFKDTSSTKIYLAKTANLVSNNCVVTYPLQTVENRTKVVVSNSGKSCCTVFVPMQNGIVLCSPVTGRTHQIRVHLQALNCSIIGDELYDGILPIHEKSNNIQQEEIKQSPEFDEFDGSWNEKIIPPCFELSEDICEQCQKETINVKPICLHCLHYSCVNLNIDEFVPFPSWCSVQKTLLMEKLTMMKKFISDNHSRLLDVNNQNKTLLFEEIT